MQIAASTILCFYTRRLYSKTPPTILFSDLVFAATGEQDPETVRLREISDNYSEKILAQCPKEFQKICREWQHVPDWQTRIELIDETFGCIPISFCA